MQALTSATLAPATLRKPNGLALFWNLFAFSLQDWVRTPWIFLNLLTIVGIQPLFYTYAPGQDHFFGVQYAVTALLAAITSGVLFSRANRSETYAILSRPVPYAIYTAALMAAAWVIAMLGQLLSAILVVIRFGPIFNPGQDLLDWIRLVLGPNGNLAVGLVALFAVALVALLSPFVSTSGVRLGVLAVLALLVMAFDSRNFPIDQIRPLIQALPPLLAPIAGTLKFGTQAPDDVARLSLLVLAVYTLILVVATLILSSRRELILD